MTGFHDDTIVQEVQDTLKEIMTTIGMSMDQVQTRCPTKPITHPFLQTKDNDESNNFVKSANILKKELRGRKIKTSPRRFHQKKLVPHPPEKCSIVTDFGVFLKKCFSFFFGTGTETFFQGAGTFSGVPEPNFVPALGLSAFFCSTPKSVSRVWGLWLRVLGSGLKNFFC